MPKINWNSVDKAKFRQRILEERRASKTTDEDVVRFVQWKESNPDVPQGNWYAHFGSFILPGTESHPDTILSGNMTPWGQCVYPVNKITSSQIAAAVFGDEE